jgi:hypothetical protein
MIEIKHTDTEVAAARPGEATVDGVLVCEWTSIGSPERGQ